jgi:hypothetical protein
LAIADSSGGIVASTTARCEATIKCRLECGAQGVTDTLATADQSQATTPTPTTR